MALSGWRLQTQNIHLRQWWYHALEAPAWFEFYRNFCWLRTWPSLIGPTSDQCRIEHTWNLSSLTTFYVLKYFFFRWRDQFKYGYIICLWVKNQGFITNRKQKREENLYRVSCLIKICLEATFPTFLGSHFRIWWENTMSESVNLGEILRWRPDRKL